MNAWDSSIIPSAVDKAENSSSKVLYESSTDQGTKIRLTQMASAQGERLKSGRRPDAGPASSDVKKDSRLLVGIEGR